MRIWSQFKLGPDVDFFPQTQESCSAVDEHGDVFDLSALMRGSHLALLMNPDPATATPASYYLSVCSALNPIQDVLCPPMAAACMLEQGKQPKVRTRFLKLIQSQSFINLTSV